MMHCLIWYHIGRNEFGHTFLHFFKSDLDVRQPPRPPAPPQLTGQDKNWADCSTLDEGTRGSGNFTGENLEVVWAEFSTLTSAV
jgi:hypothetical protein